MFHIADANIVRNRDVESREILENDAHARLETLDVVVSVVSYVEPVNGSMGRITESCQQRPIKTLVGAQFSGLARPNWLPSIISATSPVNLQVFGIRSMLLFHAVCHGCRLCINVSPRGLGQEPPAKKTAGIQDESVNLLIRPCNHCSSTFGSQ